MINNIIDAFLNKIKKEKLDSRLEQEREIDVPEFQIDIGLSSFLGQERPITLLKVAVHSAVERKESLDHILLCGLPGLGKSLLARAIANEMCALYKGILASSLASADTRESIYAFLKLPSRNKILFIDEIHGISRRHAEELYDVMQDFVLHNRSIPPFTLIGATTYPGSVDEPLRHRFPIVINLEPYDEESLTSLIIQRFDEFPPDIAQFVAARSKGLPRLAIHYSSLIRNAAIESEFIEEKHAEFIMELLGIHEDGLTNKDIEILQILNQYNRPISRDSLLAMARVDKSEYTTLIEPILLNRHLIETLPRGRKISSTGRAYLRNLREEA